MRCPKIKYLANRFFPKVGMVFAAVTVLLMIEAGCSKHSDFAEPLNLVRDGVITNAPYYDLVLLPSTSLLDREQTAIAGVKGFQNASYTSMFPSFVGKIDPTWIPGDVCLVWMLDAKPKSVGVSGNQIVLQGVTRTKGLWFGWYTGLRGRTIKEVESQIVDLPEFNKWGLENEK